MYVDNSFIPTDDIGGLIHISDGKGGSQGFGGYFVLSYESLVYAVDLGSRVYDCGGFNGFHGEWRNGEFQQYVQGISSLGYTFDYYGEFLH